MTIHPDFQSILDDATQAEALRQRYGAMTARQIAERAIFLESYVIGLTGRQAPENLDE